MDDNIIKLLGLKQDGVKATITHASDSKLNVTLSKEVHPRFCPICGFRMYSKGIYSRTVNHPILQDNRQLTLTVKQRRYKCTNPVCSYFMSDEFSFIDKYKQNTNATDFLIVQDFRDYKATAASIARKRNVSDTYVINTFARYVDLDRLPLDEAVSVDEVFLDIPKIGKYALIIQNFITGEAIDVLPSRRKSVTEPYFSAIPIEERRKVKYLIADMYKPYHDYIFHYFPNAIHVVDSFHVIQYINNHLSGYLRRLTKKLDERDRELHEQREAELHRSLNFHHSNEYYIVKNYQWLITKNLDNIEYSTVDRYDRYLKQYMKTVDYEERLFKIDPVLKELRDLKEEYIKFNNQYAGFPELAADGLEWIINKYRRSNHKIFSVHIASTLQQNFESIVNSFIVVRKYTKKGSYISRLSNGPIESLNRIPKDLRCNGNGYTNFEHIRQRILFANRINPTIRSTPKPLKDIIAHTGKKRGPYKKNNKEDSVDE